MKTLELPFSNPLTAQLDVHGIWHISIFIGCTGIVLGWLTTLKTLTYLQRVLWGYVLIYALYLFEFPHINFGAYNTAYQVTAAQCFTETLLIPVGVLLFYNKLLKLIPFVVIYELLCVWMNWDGLLIAPSFNSAFCATAIPFLSTPLKIMTWVTLVTHHGTTALLIIGLQALAYGLKLKRYRKWAIPLVLLLIGLSFFHQHEVWFDSGERLRKYSEFMTFWMSRLNWVVFGVGPGTFTWTSLILDKFEGNLFLQLHSDWLQILWELGAVGLLLSVGVFVESVRRAWDDPHRLAAIFGCAAFALTYHPLRFMPSALLTALIFSYRKEKDLTLRR